MTRKLAVAALLSTLLMPAFAAPVVEVKKIAGKPEAEVSKLLGKPAKCEQIKQGRKCVYRNERVEVVFISGIADWITVGELNQVPFSPAALSAIGLEERDPTLRTPFLMRWTPLHGLKSISVFKGDKGVDYAYIRAITP